MNIIGWIREGDKAACGGTVVEGDLTCTSHGRAYSFHGARMACRKNCVIAEGFIRSTLTNGRSQVIHGMMTSGGCPLTSTLNDIDGVGNESGDEIPIRHVQNEDGEWVGKMNEGYDQHFHLTDEVTGQSLGNRFYRMTCNGRVIEGYSDSNGHTSKIETDDPAEVTIEIFPEGYTGKSMS
jgi:uncharacterized Zn-binding protein involved in type VI secretion